MIQNFKDLKVNFNSEYMIKQGSTLKHQIEQHLASFIGKLRVIVKYTKAPVFFFGVLPAQPCKTKFSSRVNEYVDSIHNYFFEHEQELEQEKIFFKQVAKVPKLSADESFFDPIFTTVNSEYLGVVNSLMATVVKKHVYL